MPTIGKGQMEIRVVIEKNSDIHKTLQDWARHRGIPLGTATRCILADWTDALHGKQNPFGLTIAGVGTLSGPAQSTETNQPSYEEELSPEEKARNEAALAAAEQFL